MAVGRAARHALIVESSPPSAGGSSTPEAAATRSLMEGRLGEIDAL
jgi:hypothetical protein